MDTVDNSKEILNEEQSIELNTDDSTESQSVDDLDKNSKSFGLFLFSINFLV